MCHIYQKHFWGTWWFHRSKNFEAIKAGELAIWTKSSPNLNSCSIIITHRGTSLYRLSLEIYEFCTSFFTSLQNTKIIIHLIRKRYFTVVLTLKEAVVLASIIPDEWLSMFRSLESAQQPQGLGLWQSYFHYLRNIWWSLKYIWYLCSYKIAHLFYAHLIFYCNSIKLVLGWKYSESLQ